jgi:hypothetical protein
MKLSTSRLDRASSLIACWSWGVITSDWLWRRSRRGPKAMATARSSRPDRGGGHPGSAIELLRAAGEQHLAVVDDAGAVDDVERLADIVVGDEDADVALLQLDDEVANVGDRDRIDAGEGLVEQHDRGVGGERPGDLAAPPFAARQRHGRRVAQMGDVELAEQLLEPLAPHRLVGLGHLEHRHDVLGDGEAAEDRRLLRQIAEAEDRAAVHGQAGNVLAVEQDAAAVGLHQAHDRIEAGRLAGAVGAEQADHLAALDSERDVLQHRLACRRIWRSRRPTGRAPARRWLRLVPARSKGGDVVHPLRRDLGEAG